MGLIEFAVLTVVVVVIAWLCVWAMGVMAPGHPVTIDRIVWGVAVLVVIVVLARALGLTAYDPQIPRLR